MIPREIEAVAALGWHVYPCSRTTKAGLFRGATDAATSDLNVIARWARDYDGCNWRVVFGPSRLWGLDCDVPPGHACDGIAGLAALVRVHGAIPPRPQARSGGGGLGLFFAWSDERIVGESGNPAPGIDPRRGRQSQTIPPSVHIVTRRPYRWIDPPWSIAPPRAPEWLLRLVRPPDPPAWKKRDIDTSTEARAKLHRATIAVQDAPDGTRNGVLNARAYAMGKLCGAGLLADQEAADALYGAARLAGLDDLEIRNTIRSGLLSGIRSAANGRAK